MSAPRATSAPRRLHVGTSGWVYAEWAGRFYPEDLPERRWLEHYQRCLRTVELNVTFYRLPRESVFAGWAERAPAGFRFAVKAPRLVTHYRRLREVAGVVSTFLARARLLGDHLGPILWQLPASLGRDDDLLDGFVGSLPRDLVHAFEFRDLAWFAEPVYEVLRRHGAALVLWHMVDRASPVVDTGRHVYLRFHGTAGPYRGRYPKPQLARWASRVRGWLDEGREVWAYFNNDVDAQAPEDARRLTELVASERTGRGSAGPKHASARKPRARPRGR